ncbi:hypothetical protein [Zavarzinia sp. CC-PAN008]|uniref:hypothetical protein n=1 Tax=Zavarzinia sp. CC-PAN008 TaxID=3243332 RepID=UPI003F7453AC
MTESSGSLAAEGRAGRAGLYLAIALAVLSVAINMGMFFVTRMHDADLSAREASIEDRERRVAADEARAVELQAKVTALGAARDRAQTQADEAQAALTEVSARLATAKGDLDKVLESTRAAVVTEASTRETVGQREREKASLVTEIENLKAVRAQADADAKEALDAKEEAVREMNVARAASETAKSELRPKERAISGLEAKLSDLRRQQDERQRALAVAEQKAIVAKQKAEEADAEASRAQEVADRAEARARDAEALAQQAEERRAAAASQTSEFTTEQTVLQGELERVTALLAGLTNQREEIERLLSEAIERRGQALGEASQLEGRIAILRRDEQELESLSALIDQRRRELADLDRAISQRGAPAAPQPPAATSTPIERPASVPHTAEPPLSTGPSAEPTSAAAIPEPVVQPPATGTVRAPGAAGDPVETSR